MKKYVSNYIYPVKGKELTENGKPCGKLVIAPESRDLSVFGNVKEIKKVVEYTADEKMIFQNKTDASIKKFVINEEELADFEEVAKEEK